MPTDTVPARGSSAPRGPATTMPVGGLHQVEVNRISGDDVQLRITSSQANGGGVRISGSVHRQITLFTRLEARLDAEEDAVKVRVAAMSTSDLDREILDRTEDCVESPDDWDQHSPFPSFAVFDVEELAEISIEPLGIDFLEITLTAQPVDSKTLHLTGTWTSHHGLAKETLIKLERAKQEITFGYGTEPWDDDPDDTIVIGAEPPLTTSR